MLFMEVYEIYPTFKIYISTSKLILQIQEVSPIFIELVDIKKKANVFGHTVHY